MAGVTQLTKYGGTRKVSKEDVHLRPDLVIPKWVESRFSTDVMPDCKVALRAEWSSVRLEYEIVMLTVENPKGLASEDFRLLSRPDLLQAALDGTVEYEEHGQRHELRWTRERIASIAQLGPTEASLLWLSRLYAQFRAQGRPANKGVIAAVGAPASTVNRWIALARQKELLD